MSFNDRCGEAAEVLAHGGVLPGLAVDHLVDFLRDSKETCAAPRGLVRAILDEPGNRHLVDQCWDGEWQGPDEATATPPELSPTAGDVDGEGGAKVANVPSEPQNGDLTAREHDWTQTGRAVQTSAASGRRCRKCARWEPNTDATLPGWQG